MSQTKVACIQMNSSEDISENLMTAAGFIREAAEAGAQLLILPENFALMGIDQADTIKHRELLGQGVIQSFLSEQAASYHVWIVGGTLPIAFSDDNKAYASCLIFDDQGQRVARYDKIHLFDVTLNAGQESYLESKVIVPGNKVVVVPSPFGQLGIAVCYDLRFPELFRLMQQQGAEVFVLPAAFTYVTGVAHWDILVRARAIENLSYIMTACQTGTHSNTRKTYGHSMVVNPWGEVQVCLPENPGIIISELNLDFLSHLRTDFPALKHRKM